MAETLFEQESAGMSPLDVYEATQARFRRDLMSEGSPLASWSRGDMLAGRVLAWRRIEGGWTTSWFFGFPVTMAVPCGH